ncbi:MAG: 4-hydroxy-tetrahydrodipicolinate reductase [Chloroflexi bacterium]|nr:4-hydroxy-tetrahydrodipicolinate reductase [Chloroflexota bacterium]
MEGIRVAVTGATGKMGREVVGAVARAEDLALVGAVSRQPHSPTLATAAGAVPLSADLADLIDRTHPAVLVDFTAAETSMAYLRTALARGVSVVSGTTGFRQADLDEIQRLAAAHQAGAVVAANFAIGAVLMMHFARLMAPFFDFAEIIELHHEQKLDAPSGTALATARAMAKARGRSFEHRLPQKQTLEGTRGGALEGIAIHSVRMPGLVAHQEIIAGGPGQTLTIRHDSIGRESFMPGVLLAIREVARAPRVIYGLEPLLGLNES